MPKKLIIYHGNCPDGFAAAFVFWSRFGTIDTAYYEGVYGNKPPIELATNRDVFILDFSYPLEDMLAIQKVSNRLTVLDHHETAERILKTLKPRDLDCIYFDMKHSGAVLAYNYLCNVSNNETNVPWFYRLVEDRDLWKKKYGQDTDFVYKTILSYPFDFEIWWDKLKPFANDIQNLIDEGKVIDRYYQQMIKTSVLPNASLMFIVVEKNGEEKNWKLERVPVVNCNYCFSSDALNILARDHPFAASYYRLKSGDYLFSLRSHKNGMAVNKIAEIYGGGGHVHAAGFRSRELTNVIRHKV